jgi:hypothetical protein
MNKLSNFVTLVFKVFENTVLRRILEPKKQVLIEGWEKLHNKEFQNLCSLQIML